MSLVLAPPHPITTPTEAPIRADVPKVNADAYNALLDSIEAWLERTSKKPTGTRKNKAAHLIKA